MFTKKFAYDALERAITTAAQSALLALGAGQLNALHADWVTVGGFAAGGFVLALLKAVIAARTVGSLDSASFDPNV